MKFRIILMGLLVAPAVAGPAEAAETVSYTYDTLGRLTTTTTSGGPNSGMAMSTTFDAAGNRTTYTVTGASAALQMSPFAGDRQLARAEAAAKRGVGPNGTAPAPHGGL